MKREKVNLNNSHFDSDGYLVDNYTGVKYIPITSDDVVITPNTRYYNDAYSSSKNYYDPESLPFIGPMSYWLRMMSSYILVTTKLKLELEKVLEIVRLDQYIQLDTIGRTSYFNCITEILLIRIQMLITQIFGRKKRIGKKFADRVYSNNRARRGRSYKKYMTKRCKNTKIILNRKTKIGIFQTYLGRQFDHKLLQPTNERPQKSNLMVDILN